MKRCSCLTVWLVVLLLAGCAGDNVYRSSRQQRPVHINGFPDDWEAEMVYDIKSGILAGISNDNRYLYVVMKISSPVLKQKILMTGLTLWIDPSGKKKKDKGLVFPMQQAPGMKQAMRNPENKNRGMNADRELINSRYEAGMEAMELINLLGVGTTEIANNISPIGVNGMIRITPEDDLVYEVCLPLNRLFPEPELYLVDSLKTFSVGFETGKLEIPMDRPGNNAGHGMGQGIGPTGMAPARKQGMGAGQNPEINRSALAESSKYWLKKVILSPASN